MYKNLELSHTAMSIFNQIFIELCGFISLLIHLHIGRTFWEQSIYYSQCLQFTARLIIPKTEEIARSSDIHKPIKCDHWTWSNTGRKPLKCNDWYLLYKKLLLWADQFNCVPVLPSTFCDFYCDTNVVIKLHMQDSRQFYSLLDCDWYDIFV